MKRRAAHSVYDRNMVAVTLTSSICLVSAVLDSQMYDTSTCFLWHGIITHHMASRDDVCRTAAAHSESDLTLGSRIGLYGGYRGVTVTCEFPGLPSITRRKILGEIVDAEGRPHDWNEYGEPSTHLKAALVPWGNKLYI